MHDPAQTSFSDFIQQTQSTLEVLKHCQCKESLTLEIGLCYTLYRRAVRYASPEELLPLCRTMRGVMRALNRKHARMEKA